MADRCGLAAPVLPTWELLTTDSVARASRPLAQEEVTCRRLCLVNDLIRLVKLYEFFLASLV